MVRDVIYYELTPTGVQRVESGFMPGLEISEKGILRFLYKWGGAAEVDEIRVGTGMGTLFSDVSLNKLMEKGLVAPAGTPVSS